jgi:tetratricopeptide (TPR) repeat protein
MVSNGLPAKFMSQKALNSITVTLWPRSLEFLVRGPKPWEMIVYMSDCALPLGYPRSLALCLRKRVLPGLMMGVFLLVLTLNGQTQTPDWQAQVRRYAERKDWVSAMRIVDQEIARAPGDMDVRAWRARILQWSGHLAQAEAEYLQILQVSKSDADNWLGLANVYLAENKPHDALRALDMAVKLDPGRADLHMARGRALAAVGDRRCAQLEFQQALRLDPANDEVRIAQTSVVGDLKNELRFGEENNAFNFVYPNYDEWLSLRTQWNQHWSTTLLGNFFQWGPANAGKFVGSVTGRLPQLGALTVGGAAGHDSGVLPKREGFFELDHGWKTGESGFLRGLELTYGQHWYWYNSSVRILALTGVTLLYLPREWTFSVGVTEAQSAFPGLGTQWRPSGIARLGFPIMSREQKRLSGNVFFATGTEDFASLDQIGSFASQTYGAGLRFFISARQDIGPYASYQKRSLGRTDANFGLSYGYRF